MTKDEAEAKLAVLPLDRAVAVTDVPDAGKGARQRLVYSVPGVNATVEIEIDANPTPAQLETLANNLPVPADKRAEVAAKLAEAKLAAAEAAKS